MSSSVYKNPISVNKSTLIKVAAVMNNEMVDETINNLTINKATGLKVELSEAPSKYYDKGGVAALTNGVFGSSKRYGDYDWLGWSRAGVEANLDFNQLEVVSSISLRFFHQISSWVWMPKKVEIWTSSDGVNYVLVKEEKISVPNQEGAIDVSIQIPQRELRFLKVKVESGGLIPENNPGAGSQSWFFMDEIVVN
jgi:hexosaminidase